MLAAAPDGVVAAYVWDYAGRMELMRHFWDAAVALDPAAADLDEGVRFPICRPERLEAIWRGASLADVASRAIDVPTVFRDFDDYWRPFLGGQGPAPGYAMSLDEERRTALRERIRAALPVAGDGSIRLVARAWAVQGRSGKESPQPPWDEIFPPTRASQLFRNIQAGISRNRRAVLSAEAVTRSTKRVTPVAPSIAWAPTIAADVAARPGRCTGADRSHSRAAGGRDRLAMN
jgi:hypothetical protein